MSNLGEPRVNVVLRIRPLDLRQGGCNLYSLAFQQFNQRGKVRVPLQQNLCYAYFHQAAKYGYSTPKAIGFVERANRAAILVLPLGESTEEQHMEKTFWPVVRLNLIAHLAKHLHSGI